MASVEGFGSPMEIRKPRVSECWKFANEFLEFLGGRVGLTSVVHYSDPELCKSLVVHGSRAFRARVLSDPRGDVLDCLIQIMSLQYQPRQPKVSTMSKFFGIERPIVKGRKKISIVHWAAFGKTSKICIFPSNYHSLALAL